MLITAGLAGRGSGVNGPAGHSRGWRIRPVRNTVGMTGAALTRRAAAPWRRARRNRWLAHLVRAGGRYDQADGGPLAAAITYDAFFATFAVTLLGLAVFGFVLDNPAIDLPDLATPRIPRRPPHPGPRRPARPGRARAAVDHLTRRGVRTHRPGRPAGHHPRRGSRPGPMAAGHPRTPGRTRGERPAV